MAARNNSCTLVCTGKNIAGKFTDMSLLPLFGTCEIIFAGSEIIFAGREKQTRPF